MNKKKFVLDFCLNLTAVGLPIVLMQLVFQPIMSRRMTPEDFGLFITIVSLLSMVSGVFGGSMDNLLLLNAKSYPDKKSDFNVVFAVTLAVNTLALVLLTWYYEGGFYFSSVVMSTVTGLLLTVFQYFAAEYRLKLEYGKVLIAGVLKSVGYAVGFLIYHYTGVWYAILLASAGFDAAYCIFTTDVKKYPFTVSENMPTLVKSYFLILGASLAANAVGYLDKLIIYPMFGGEETAVYNAATIIAKAVVMAAGPIASVLLSYLVRRSSISVKKYNMLVGIALAACIPLFVVIVVACKYVLPFLYPMYAEAAMAYVPYTATFTLLSILISFLSPLLLVRVGEGASLVFQITHAVVYLVCGFVGISLRAVTGFCIAKCVSYVIMVTLLYIVLLINIKNGRNKDESRKIVNVADNTEGVNYDESEASTPTHSDADADNALL